MTLVYISTIDVESIMSIKKKTNEFYISTHINKYHIILNMQVPGTYINYYYT